MVHGGDHGDNAPAIGKGQDADLRSGQKFLNDDSVSGIAEGPLLHDDLHGPLRLFQRLGNQHPLAQGQPVGLDDGGEGHAGAPETVQGRGGVVKDLIPGGGDAVLFHQVLGEDLAGLDAGGLGAWPKAGDAGLVEPVHAPQGQGVVRRHHGETNGMGSGEVHDFVNVPGSDLRHAHRVGGNAAVAGEGVDGLNGGILFQLFDDGVFAAAAADYKQIHNDIPHKGEDGLYPPRGDGTGGDCPPGRTAVSLSGGTAASP